MIGIFQDGISAELFIELFAFILAIIFCMTIHEYAHAKVAYMQGDDTAYLKGRLTLNPIAHLDLFGFMTLLLFGFGWAKPVPINPIKFKNFRKGIFLTSIAGIVTNIFAGFFCAGLYVLFSNLLNLATAETFGYFITGFLQMLFYFAMVININLAIFNLIPIFPLDGYNVLKIVCKPENKFVQFVERYSFILSIVLLILCFSFSFVSYCSYYIYFPFVKFWEFVWVF